MFDYEKKIAVLANLTVIGGFFLALLGARFVYSQINQTTSIEKKRVAIEAINQVRSSDFLKALARLKTINAQGSKSIEVQQSFAEEDKKLLIDDINYVTNLYGYIAVLYVQDLADRCIIKKTCYTALKDLSEFCSNTSECPSQNKRDLDEALRLMNEETCR